MSIEHVDSAQIDSAGNRQEDEIPGFRAELHSCITPYLTNSTVHIHGAYNGSSYVDMLEYADSAVVDVLFVYFGIESLAGLSMAPDLGSELRLSPCVVLPTQKRGVDMTTFY